MFPTPVPRQLRQALSSSQHQRGQQLAADAGHVGGQQERPGGRKGRLGDRGHDSESGDRRLYGLLRHLGARVSRQRPPDVHRTLPEQLPALVRARLPVDLVRPDPGYRHPSVKQN